MGLKTLELTLISAKDLKNVNLIGKMDVYVVVSLSGDPKTKQKTPVHQDGGTSPHWNHTMTFTVDDAAHSPSMLVFNLKHDAFGPDKDVGEVRVPLGELLNGFRDKKDPQFLTYQVRRPSGKPHGELKFSYKLTDLAPPPAATYPPPQACSSSGGTYAHPAMAYPPPPTSYPPEPAGYRQAPAYGYPPPYGGYPPQQGGYPPQQAGYGGYGYPPAAAAAPGGFPVQGQYGQKPKKSGGFGMGLGAGLIGGAVGGLLVGEMVSDVCEDGFDL